MEENMINIVVCGDKNIEIGLHCTLFSMLENSTSNNHNIYFIQRGYSLEDIEKLNYSLKPFDGRYNLIDIKFDETIFSELKSLHGNKFAYTKLVIPELINISRVIYLDLDIIVKMDVVELNAIDLQNYVIAANTEFSMKDSLEKELYGSIGFDMDAPYFNSGIMLINLDLWREQNITKKCMEFAKKYGDKLQTADQTVLNFYFYNNFKFLSEQFNYRVSNKSSVKELADYVGILHFFGRPKPWDLFAELIHPQHKLYKSVLSKTYFANYKSYQNISKNSFNKLLVTYKSYIKAILKL